MAVDPMRANMFGVKEELRDTSVPCPSTYQLVLEFERDPPYHMAIFIRQAAEADERPAESKTLTISEKLTAKMEEAGPTTLLMQSYA
jgi:hypothetical protein